ncbi:hypothetical protein HAV22_26045 [Massilia sp. TW-1]|uniref:Uncharacterized protein n=1 Tax=Telluria antibiotica TaxID=2717319 RepID=A0ABX0PKQ2_9BURK|nr:hypothetical protein [Telluria antibiotica]NIA57089.1 hypothetical protein [Telluria antibiotica]
MKTQSSNIPREAILSKAFQERRRSDVFKWDVYPIDEQCVLRLVFESWKETCRHGLRLAVEGSLMVNGHVSSSIEIWADTAPREVRIAVLDSTGRLSVYNLWDAGQGKQSQSHTSGMLIEPLPKGRRYRCNDIGLVTSFDDLVFRIEVA